MTDARTLELVDVLISEVLKGGDCYRPEEWLSKEEFDTQQQNIKQAKQTLLDHIASLPCTTKPVVSQNEGDLVSKHG